MTTIELLAYCRVQECVPDLVWQREMHRDENLRALCDEEAFLAPNGHHDMYDVILETHNWLLQMKRTYATVLFAESAACSEPQD